MKIIEVIMTCKVRKLVTCEVFDGDEFNEDKVWEFAVDETELDQLDWEIDSIKTKLETK